MTTIHAALRDRLLVCTDVGEGWETTPRLEGRDLECVSVSPAAPDRIFVGTFESGLYRSTDGGDSFESIGSSIGESAVMSLAISPHDPDVVYAGTEPSRIYRSRDGGDSWDRLEGLSDLPSEPEWYFPPRPQTHHVRWIEVDPFDPERLYVGIELGALVVSEDGGESWRERPPGSRRDNHSLATHPDHEGRVYSAAGDGYAESDDGGESWEHPQDGLEHTYCWSVVPDPGDPDRVLVSAASGARSAHTPERADSYVYRKSGGRWEHLEDRGLPTGEGVVRAVFATTGEPGEVVAVTNRGLFRTDDFGDDWTRLSVEWGDDLERQTPRGLAVVD
ncbi:WD40/YVTN/BNR-like repeat-containing protein [Natrialbaceae archaeon AArc-T1-2]|uniref:WD40/YVTN/BNR-like repeat-containing protein n=1 Tax=Natrialbaceae archaeon AArc-T1-2 TaxID=3053904 RepID=UPI00255B0EFA|nr:hypothetical protein [Natrialbaceae archaeon AArc-T1-2]WIV65708.1 hypothetical protein QQ977_08305 [Natrialbaceae archaeon AArc-T1-2]